MLLEVLPLKSVLNSTNLPRSNQCSRSYWQPPSYLPLPSWCWSQTLLSPGGSRMVLDTVPALCHWGSSTARARCHHCSRQRVPCHDLGARQGSSPLLRCAHGWLGAAAAGHWVARCQPRGPWADPAFAVPETTKSILCSAWGEAAQGSSCLPVLWGANAWVLPCCENAWRLGMRSSGHR